MGATKNTLAMQTSAEEYWHAQVNCRLRVWRLQKFNWFLPVTNKHCLFVLWNCWLGRLFGCHWYDKLWCLSTIISLHKDMYKHPGNSTGQLVWGWSTDRTHVWPIHYAHTTRHTLHTGLLTTWTLTVATNLKYEIHEKAELGTLYVISKCCGFCGWTNYF